MNYCISNNGVKFVSKTVLKWWQLSLFVLGLLLSVILLCYEIIFLGMFSYILPSALLWKSVTNCAF